MDYEKKYKNAIENMRRFRDALNNHEETDLWVLRKEIVKDIEYYFPELKENKIKNMREQLIKAFGSIGKKEWGGVNVKDAIAWLEKQGGNSAPININKMVMEYSQTKDGDFGLPVNCQIRAYRQGLTDAIHTLNLEKQGNSSVKWQKNTLYNKPAINHSILMKTIQGIAEGEWQGEHWFQYRWSWTFKDSEVLAWMELSDLNEQGEQKTADKSATTKQEDEIEIPFGAKDSELIEDTYFIPDGFHAEIDDDKVVIKKGEKPTEWSDKDEEMLKWTNGNLTELKDQFGEKYGKVGECIPWLKSLKQRIGWKPSEEQIHAFIQVFVWYSNNFIPSAALISLYNDLKNL